MKTVLIASDTFLPRWDGIVRFLSEIIPRLLSDYKIIVLCPDYGRIRKQHDYKIISFDVFSFQMGDYYPSKVNVKVAAKMIKHADMVWVQSLGTIGAISILLAKRYHKPVIFYMHLLEWETFPKSIGRAVLKKPIHFLTGVVAKRFYNLCDMIFVPSAELVEILTWQNITTRKKIIHLGVDTSKFKPAISKEQAKKTLGYDANSFIIGYVGRLAYEKNLRTLLRAFLRFEKRHPEAKLLIVGGGRKDIMDWFVGKKNVIVAGPQDDVVPYFQAMDIYVLPSFIETTSLSTVEAMSCGLPVVVSYVGYIKEYVVEKENGFFFSKTDSYSLYKKMELLQSSFRLRREIGANARKTVIEKFSWEKTVEEIRKALREF